MGERGGGGAGGAGGGGEGGGWGEGEGESEKPEVSPSAFWFSGPSSHQLGDLGQNAQPL